MCGATADIETALEAFATGRSVLEQADHEEAIFIEHPSPPALQHNLPEPKVEIEPRFETSGRGFEAKPSGHFAERLLIGFLALLFLGVGLAAAGLSGFANYQAFSASVSDPVQGKIWGVAGVLASIISFSGFTFFWWHASQTRRAEAFRSLVFALTGAAASLLGTQMYIDANNKTAAAEIAQAEAARPVLEAQIEDWRTQLAGIPAETRSVEGLEAYLAGVEQVGRTHQKPYRDAQNELGLAKRRDELQAKIEAATAGLLSTDEQSVLVSGPAQPALPAWFFAAILEVFSSQGTSLGFVALLILFGRRNA